MSDDTRTEKTRPNHTPWNKGKLTGPKAAAESARDLGDPDPPPARRSAP
jgi:hypothetical protein